MPNKLNKLNAVSNRLNKLNKIHKSNMPNVPNIPNALIKILKTSNIPQPIYSYKITLLIKIHPYILWLEHLLQNQISLDKYSI